MRAGEPIFAYETDKRHSRMLRRLTAHCSTAERGGDDIPVMEGVCVIGQPGEGISELLSTVPQRKSGEAQSADQPARSNSPRVLRLPKVSV